MFCYQENVKLFARSEVSFQLSYNFGLVQLIENCNADIKQNNLSLRYGLVGS